MRKGKRPQQNRVNGGEHGAIGADTQRQSQDDRYRKSRCATHQAQSAPEIRPHPFEQGDRMDVAQSLGGLLLASEFQQSLSARFGGSDAARKLLAHRLFDMKLQLTVELRLVALVFP